MAKDKLNNLLSFDQYGELKQFKKSTKRTEIGGDVVNERKSGCSCSKPVMKPKKMAIKKSKHILEFSVILLDAFSDLLIFLNCFFKCI